MVTQDKLIQLLQEGVVTVSFIKKDGTTRVLRGTRNSLLIPAEDLPAAQPADAPVKKTKPGLVKVYDLDIHEWRSFNFDTITDVSVDIDGSVDPLTKAVGLVVVIAAVVYGLTLV